MVLFSATDGVGVCVTVTRSLMCVVHLQTSVRVTATCS